MTTEEVLKLTTWEIFDIIKNTPLEKFTSIHVYTSEYWNELKNMIVNYSLDKMQIVVIISNDKKLIIKIVSNDYNTREFSEDLTLNQYAKLEEWYLHMKKLSDDKTMLIFNYLLDNTEDYE